MFIKKLIIGLLSFYTFDLKRRTFKDDFIPREESRIERMLETRKKREAEKKKTRLYDRRKWKKKRQYKEKSFKIQGTNPKDLRFSGQQKLRRMYRNS